MTKHTGIGFIIIQAELPETEWRNDEQKLVSHKEWAQIRHPTFGGNTLTVLFQKPVLRTLANTQSIP